MNTLTAQQCQLPVYYNTLPAVSTEYATSIIQATSSQSINTIANKKIVIFDWDDTLFPTSEFSRKLFGKNLDGKTITKLSEKILEIIKKSCLLYGVNNVFIVTNGSNGWVQHSLTSIIKYCSANNIKNSFQQILDLISRNCITTLSAKDLYSKQCPNQTMLWKYYTFDTIVQFTNANTIISIGDSMDEYLASEYVSKSNENDNIHSLHRLKLTKTPRMNFMNQQFEFILDLLDLCLTATTDVDINLDQEIAKRIN